MPLFNDNYWTVNVLLKDDHSTPVNSGFPGSYTFSFAITNSNTGLLAEPPASSDPSGFDAALLSALQSMFESMSYTTMDGAATDAGFTPPLSYDSIQVEYTDTSNTDVTP